MFSLAGKPDIVVGCKNILVYRHKSCSLSTRSNIVVHLLDSVAVGNETVSSDKWYVNETTARKRPIANNRANNGTKRINKVGYVYRYTTVTDSNS
jgi:hypothetical protein